MAKKATPEQLAKIKELFEKFKKSAIAGEKAGYKTHIQQILSDIEVSYFTTGLIGANEKETIEIIKNAIEYYS